jgi:protein phosphatase
MNNKLILLIGMPASGKTHFCKSLRNYNIVSPDEIRSKLFGVQFNKAVEPQVWKCVSLQVKNHLRNKRNVVLDATNLYPQYRKRFIDLADKFGARRQAILFDIPLKKCLERDLQRKNSVGESVIIRMHYMFKKLMKNPNVLYEEGFDSVQFQSP